MKDRARTLININRRTFVQVTALLLALLMFSIILTYIVPKGEFGQNMTYVPRSDIRGIPVLNGIFAPVLVFFSSDGLTLIMLSLFLIVISAAFQVMSDCNGIRAIVGSVSERFKERKFLLLVIISFLFYCFGAFLGLFEEMLTMLPIITALCISIGFDSFTGFICSILACGFGFAGAITNPFTVLLASRIVGVNPLVNIWYRLVVFAVMFGLLMVYLKLYLKKIEANPESSITYAHDREIKKTAYADGAEVHDAPRLRIIFSAFLLVALAMIITVSMTASLRDYAVVILTAYFLIFGLLAGVAATGSFAKSLRSFLNGVTGALPTVVFIALAASIKYVFEAGGVLPTIVNSINSFANGNGGIATALSIYLIVLLLEFFISSSTAKAILVMGILAVANTGLSKELLVLLYTFGDGYTNVIFPTSPVLLISLSMIEVDYLKWVKKGAPLFIANLILVIGFITLGVVIGY